MNDDLVFDRALQRMIRGFIIAALVGASIIYGCQPDNTHLEDCSNRGKPQIYDTQRKEWRCPD